MSGELKKDRHIVFSIDDIVYSSPLSSVSKILELKSFDKIPYAPDFVIGETYYEENNIYIVDFKKIFKKNQTSEHGNILLIYKSSPHLVSIVADKLERINYLDLDTVHHDKLINSKEAKVIKGSYRYKDKTAFIIDISGVVELDYFRNLEESEEDQSSNLLEASGG